MSTASLAPVKKKGYDSNKDYYAYNKKPGGNIITKNLPSRKYMSGNLFCL